MPDLWDSGGPSLPSPGGPEPSALDRSGRDAHGRSADVAIEHMDGATCRVGTVGEGETPFPFEQVHRGLDRELAGLYGADAVPGVRQALRDAVATEGLLSAYDRFGADPSAFGDLRSGVANAELLGRQLRELEVYRAYCVEHGHLVPVEPDVDTRSLRPSGVYVTGPDAEATVAALDRYSALDLSRDSATGRLVDAPITAEQEGALGVQDRWLLRAVQGWKTDVTLETTRADTAPDLDGVERQVVVGRYDGSRVDTATEQVEARQVFNLRHAQVLERAAGASVGGSVAHEIIEAYAGARGRPWRTFEESYDAAHEGAEALDEPPRREWTVTEETNRNSNQIIVRIRFDSDPDVPGLERYANLYLDPLRHARLDATGAALRHADGSPVADPGPPTSLVLPR